MRTLRIAFFSVGVLVLVALVYRLGAGSIASALRHVTWWQFALVCLVHTLNVVVDASGWRFTLPPDRAPFWKLVAARCAGDSVNVLSAVAAVGGEAVKAWVLKRDVPYEESVPSLIVAKTAETVAQALLLAVGVALALTTDLVGPGLRTAMVYLLVVEAIGVGGLLGVQIAGLVGRLGRLVRIGHAEHLDEALREFYRERWPRFLAAVGFYFVGWALGAVQGFVILGALGLPASLVGATIIEALWSAVRFTTFYVPASLGTLEGATAAAFAAFGYGSGAGLAFTLVRRASQAVWIGLGVVALLALRPDRRSGDDAVGAVDDATGAGAAAGESLGGL